MVPLAFLCHLSEDISSPLYLLVKAIERLTHRLLIALRYLIQLLQISADRVVQVTHLPFKVLVQSLDPRVNSLHLELELADFLERT